MGKHLYWGHFKWVSLYINRHKDGTSWSQPTYIQMHSSTCPETVTCNKGWPETWVPRRRLIIWHVNRLIIWCPLKCFKFFGLELSWWTFLSMPAQTADTFQRNSFMCWNLSLLAPRRSSFVCGNLSLIVPYFWIFQAHLTALYRLVPWADELNATFLHKHIYLYTNCLSNVNKLFYFNHI